ncbi:hypothetical protein [Actinophytocola sediminis]
MPEKYNTAERAALFTLWWENREVPNPELTKELNVDLRKDGRDRLNKQDLIRSWQENRRYVHRITDEGVKWCVGELVTVEPPPRSGALVRAVFGIARLLASQPGVDLRELISPSDLETLIRRAYGELSVKPQDWVRLAKLRPKLNGADKSEVDGVLLKMIKTGTVHLAPHSDRKSLTDDDRSAAIQLGDQDKHLVAIEES